MANCSDVGPIIPNELLSSPTSTLCQSAYGAFPTVKSDPYLPADPKVGKLQMIFIVEEEIIWPYVTVRVGLGFIGMLYAEWHVPRRLAPYGP